MDKSTSINIGKTPITSRFVWVKVCLHWALAMKLELADIAKNEWSTLFLAMSAKEILHRKR